MNEWTEGWMDRRMVGQKDGWKKGFIDVCIDGLMDGWSD